MTILSGDGLMFLLRWGHFLAGVTWIGMLWYFNFVQGPFFNETDAETKKNATQKLVPRALWWFRWGAMFTIITGWLIVGDRWGRMGLEFLSTSYGVTILTGGIMGTIMWANVWFVIWPAQKVVIAAAKGESVTGAAERGRRAFLASRTNTLFSIPMLFYMGAASHLPVPIENPVWMWALVAGVIVLLIELNALLATKGITTQPIETVKGVITSGVILSVVLYVLLEVLL